MELLFNMKTRQDSRRPAGLIYGYVLLGLALLHLTNAQDSPSFPTLANKGAPPDHFGAWQNLDGDSYSMIFFYGGGAGQVLYRPSLPSQANVPPLTVTQIVYQSWECTGDEGVTRSVYKFKTNTKYGYVVVEACGVGRVTNSTYRYAVDVKGCPDPSVLDSDKTAEELGLFSKTTMVRIPTEVLPPPESFVCTEGANVEGQDNLGIAPLSLDVQSTYGQFVQEQLVKPLSNNTKYPPTFENEGIFPAATGTFVDNDQENFIFQAGINVGNDFVSIGLAPLNGDGNLTYIATLGEFGSYTDLGDGRYHVSVSESQLVATLPASSEAKCLLAEMPDLYSISFTDPVSNDTCPTETTALTIVEGRQKFVNPTGPVVKDDEAAYASSLDSANQVPPLELETTASFTMTPPNYIGVCFFTLNITGVDNFTMAHIHAGNSTTNGDIAVPIVPLPIQPQQEVDGLAQVLPPVSGTVVYSGAFTQDNFTGPLEGKSMEDFIKMVEDPENFYVNVHTVADPAGAIRGQLGPVQ